MSEHQSVVLERLMNAPPALVWQMWTEAEHFAAWYGPKGATVRVTKMDLEVGGARHFSMSFQTPNGAMTMWFAGEHLDIEPVERLVYTEFMSDDAGRAIPAPGGDEIPPPTTVHVALEPRDGGTHVTLRHEGVPADSPGAKGWEMALDKLEALFD